MHPVDFLTQHLMPYYKLDSIELTDGDLQVCDCCLRPISDTPSKRYTKTKSSYGGEVSHCDSCQILFTGNTELLGVERWAGQIKIYCKSGKGKAVKEMLDSADIKQAKALCKKPTDVSLANELGINPEYLFIQSGRKKIPYNEQNGEEVIFAQGTAVPAKLGMLKGAGAAVTEDRIVFYTPKKHFQKFNGLPNFPFEFHDIGGVGIVDHALKNIKQRPLLLITNFGVKKADLVASLRISSGTVIYSCSEDGFYPVDSNAYIQLSEAFEQLDNKSFESVVTIIEKVAKGYVTPIEALSVYKEHDCVKSALTVLPTCPHERIALIKLIKRGRT